MGWWRLICVSNIDGGYLDETRLLVRLLDGVEDLQCPFVIDGLGTILTTLESASVGPPIAEGKH